jgi:peptidoglycan hydrolase-like protein with peptidoglycan-binding domain
MDYMAYSHMFMANETANDNVEYTFPKFEFDWLKFLKSSAWLALVGVSIFFTTLTHAQTASSTSTRYVTTNGSCLRVRQSPNLHSRVVDCLPNRTQIRTTETVNGFARLGPNRFVSTQWIGNAPNNRSVRSGGTGGRNILGFGSRGPAVSEVQRALGVQPTGYYGHTTTRAVREFQARNGLRVDGVVGPQTRRALFGNRNYSSTNRNYSSTNYSGTGGRAILGFGSRGPAVSEVQRALGVQSTGYYGHTTTRAVREFQARNGLRADGIVGPQTRRALFGR